MQTYGRTVRGHWVTWCNLYVPQIKEASDPFTWEWSKQYLAEKCSLSCEPETWQGELVATFKEFQDNCGNIREKGTLFGGNHYDNSCEIFDFCAWKETQ